MPDAAFVADTTVPEAQPHEPATIRIFLSSPCDVGHERKLAKDVVERLKSEFAHRADVTTVLYEQELLLAAYHFQDPRNIPPPSTTDITVVILWSRLGVTLPPEFLGPITGRRVTGTEWEFEDAIAGFLKVGRPDVLLFIRNDFQGLTFSPTNVDHVEEAARQARMLEAFKHEWVFDTEIKSAKRAYYSYRDPADFERQIEDALRMLLRRQLGLRYRAVSFRGAPYLGLRAFQVADAPIFFGRTRARAEMRDQLQRQIENGTASLLVLGASGSGKSSAVMAGLIPDLMAPGTIQGRRLTGYNIFRPSEARGCILDLLATAVSEALNTGQRGETRVTPESVSTALAASSEAIRQLISDAQHFPGAEGDQQRDVNAIAVVVDQAEELFTVASIDTATREQFLQALARLAGSGAVWVFATMRSDFYHLLEQSPIFASLSARAGQFLLRPPDEAEIHQIIAAPARKAGITFERDPETGATLDEIIALAALRHRGSLPLLEHLLDQLWHARTDDGELTFAAYHRLGGLEGAIGSTAEAAYQTLNLEAQDALPVVLRELVTIGRDDGQRATARVASLGRFPSGGPSRVLIETFCAPGARLFVADTSPSDDPAIGHTEPVVRVAHEAIFTHWPRARDQIASDRHDLALRSRLEELTLQWWAARANDRRGYLIPIGVQLDNAIDLSKRRLEILNDRTMALIVESATALRDRRRTESEQQSRDLGTLAQLRLRDGQLQAALSDAVRAMPSVDDPERPIVDIAFEALEQCLQSNQTLDIFRRHSANVLSVALSPDETTVASGDESGAILLWEPGSTDTPRRLSLDGAVRAVRWSRDGRLFAAGSATGRVGVWQCEGWAQVGDIDIAADTLWSLAFDGRSERLAVPERRAIRLYNVNDLRTPVDRLDYKQGIHAVCFDPMRRRLLTSHEDGTLALRDLEGGAIVTFNNSHQAAAYGATFSPSGRHVASTSKDKTVRVWDAATGLQLWSQLQHDLDSFDVAFVGQGETVASAAQDRTARVWSVEDGQPGPVLRGHGNWIYSIDAGRSGKCIVTASSDRTVRLWRPTPGLPHRVLAGHTGNVKAIALHPDGGSFATAGDDQSIRLWSLPDGIPGAVLEGHSSFVRGLAYMPDGRRLLSASWDETARLWDISDRRVVREFKGHEGPVRSVATDPLGIFVATASFDKTVRLWDAASGEMLRLIGPETAEAYSLAFSPDGNSLACVLKNGDLILWSTNDARVIWRVAAHKAITNFVTFSHDGRIIATCADDNTTKLWSVETGAKLGELIGHEHWVVGASFHPSNNWIVTASFDRTARIWDVNTGVRVSTLRGHTNTVYATTFDHKGEFIVTASHDASVRIWRAELDRDAIIERGRRLNALFAGGDMADDGSTPSRLSE